MKPSTKEIARLLGVSRRHVRCFKAAKAEAACREEQAGASSHCEAPLDAEIRLSQADVDAAPKWHHHLKKRFGPTR